MELKDLRERKAKMEEEISAIIESFSNDTQTEVVDICVHRNELKNERGIKVVSSIKVNCDVRI